MYSSSVQYGPCPNLAQQLKTSVKFLSRGLGGFTEEDTRRWPRLGMFCFLMGSAQVFYQSKLKKMVPVCRDYWCFAKRLSFISFPLFIVRAWCIVWQKHTKTTRLANIFLSPEALHRPRAPKIIFGLFAEHSCIQVGQRTGIGMCLYKLNLLYNTY